MLGSGVRGRSNSDKILVRKMIVLRKAVWKQDDRIILLRKAGISELFIITAAHHSLSVLIKIKMLILPLRLIVREYLLKAVKEARKVCMSLRTQISARAKQ